VHRTAARAVRGKTLEEDETPEAERVNIRRSPPCLEAHKVEETANGVVGSRTNARGTARRSVSGSSQFQERMIEV
jgi:hypothetical protein